MGMYDSINGEQVKCFGVPCYYSEDGVHPMGGALKGYGNGDKVPYKTLWYDFTPNFVIVDFDPYWAEKEGEILFHIIRDGKVFKTCGIDELNDDDFDGIEVFVDYWGYILNVNTKEGCLKKKEDAKIYSEKSKILCKEKDRLIRESMDCLHKQRELDDNDPLKKELENKGLKLLEKVEIENKILAPQIVELREKYIDIYYKTNEEYAIYQRVGIYLQAIKDYSKRKSDKVPEIKQAFNEALEIFKEEGKDAVAIYSKYSNMPTSEVEKLIKNSKY